MKIQFTLSFLFFSFLLLFQAQAQVTITQNTYPRGGTFVDSVYVSTNANITLPTEGTDQQWDYSFLSKGEVNYTDHFDASADPSFPNALNYNNNDLIFQGFIIPANHYEGLDSEGWYDLGRTLGDVTYSITAITGGPNDSLRFVGKNEVYDGRINKLQFPAEYGNERTQSRKEFTDFELTIAAFGLNRTPGNRQREVTEHREMVGYGSLVIPKADGTPAPPQEVLLLRIVENWVDSFFLGGAPAPPTLLAAFGVTQGMTTADSFYVFYRPDFGAPILNVNYTTDKHFYRPQSADINTAVIDITRSTLNVFPNPLSGGQTLTIQSEQPLATGWVRAYDLAGRLIQASPYDSASGYEIQVSVPASIPTGLYLYQLTDREGQEIAREKVQVF